MYGCAMMIIKFANSNKFQSRMLLFTIYGREFRCALRSIILLAKHMTLNLTRRLIDVRLRSSRVDGKVFRVNCHLLIKLNFIGKLRAEQPKISYSYTFGSLFIFASFKFSSISATLYVAQGEKSEPKLCYYSLRSETLNGEKILGKCLENAMHYCV